MTLKMMGFVTFGFLCAMTFADHVTILQRYQMFKSRYRAH